MPDTLSPEARSAFMARIRAKDTQPELAVRRPCHAMGFASDSTAATSPARPTVLPAAARRS